MKNKNNRHIITGGPGSGKTSLINALANKNYCCFEEVSRIIIRQQHKTKGDKLPWKNLAGFAELCFDKMSLQLNQCGSKDFCFFDRGLPDLVAYMNRGGISVPEKYLSKPDLYHSKVFIAPPWKEIFVNDAERPESFADAKDIDRFLKETYTKFGFTLIELPKVSVKARVKFVEKELNLFGL